VILSLSAVGAAACGARSHPPADPATPGAWRRAYDCTGIQFGVRFEKQAAVVFVAGREIRLPQVKAASGAKYTDGAVTFWSKGEEALLELDGMLYRSCRTNPAHDVQEPPNGDGR